MSWTDEIKAQCTACGGMFALGRDLCIEPKCRACHGSDQEFEACLATVKAQSVDQILAEAPPDALEELQDVLGRLKKKPSGVLAKIKAERRRRKKGRSREDEIPETVRVDSGHPAVTPKRVAEAQRRLDEAMGQVGPELEKLLTETTRRLGETCVAVTAQMPDESFQSRVMRLSLARRNGEITERWPRLLEDPPRGATWLAIMLRDGVNAVAMLSIGTDSPTAQ